MSSGVKGTSAGPGGVKLSRARAGDVEKALLAALADVEGELRGEQRVWAVLARRAARLVDASWRADDVSGVLRGSAQLRELVDVLPLRPRGGPARDDDRDDEPGARVLELLDRPPRVGD